MTTLSLTKHHGLGNDFLVAIGPPVDADDLPDLARRLCDRRRGIGADGLLIATPADGYTARMTLFNADGSRAEMSGNGIRCFAQAIARKLDDLEPQRILTDAGDKDVVLSTTAHADTIEARVEMGPVESLGEPADWATLQVHPDRPVAHVSLGNPHSVVGVDEVDEVDLAGLGARVPHVNLEIVEPGPEPHAITMRVHERGAGITEACGTGACASAFAARSWGLVDAGVESITVHMDGGSASVSFDGDRAILTGPATFVASIEVEL